MLTLPTAKPTAEEPSALIECAAGKFQLLLRRPSYAERMEDEGLALLHFQEAESGRAFARQQQRRLEMVVVGWHGVVDESGKSVPYTPAALTGLLTLCPDAINPTMKAVAELFQNDRKALGKSVPPPGISSEINPGETSPTPSDSTSSSPPSTTAAEPSV